MIVFKIHVKILSMYLKYYFKYMYFKILLITAPNLLKISPCSLGIRWMAFGLRRAKVLV